MGASGRNTVWVELRAARPPFLVTRLAKSPALRRDAEAAQSLGISLKRFLGWEPQRVVEHEYDEGLLVRSVETTEVEWDVEQRSWVQALADLRGQTCSGCGGWLQETTAITVEYVADHPWRCHKCEALEIRRDAVRDKPQPGSFTVWPVHERR